MPGLSVEAELNVLLGDVRQRVLDMGAAQDLPQRVAALRALLQREGFLSGSPNAQSPPRPCLLEASGYGSMTNMVTGRSANTLQRYKSIAFRMNRNQRFHDDITLEDRQFVHFHKLCKHGHWHGVAHPAHECRECVANCGGGAWSREMRHDADHHLVAKEKKRIRDLMRRAVRYAVERAHRRNPYRNFALDVIPRETVEQITYHVRTQAFRVRSIDMHLEGKEFARGAMRACWRMLRTHPDGGSDACVAKQYFREDQTTQLPARSLLKYYVDTKMQAVAKHYAEMFSAHPECFNTVDFVEAYMIRRAADPAGNPSLKALYCVENYLQGDYVKHNNNSGYCLTSRCTPQAFSHFTYAKSGGKMMVVDIQGVGDLYTDPQIHTSCGTDFGDGNLGVTGFALFFQSHVCNYTCKAMKLRPFEVFPDFSMVAAKAAAKITRQPAADPAPGSGQHTTIKQMAAEMNLNKGGATGPVGFGQEIAFSELRADAIVPTSLLLNGGEGHAEVDEKAAAQDASTGVTIRPERREAEGGHTDLNGGGMLRRNSTTDSSALMATDADGCERITNPPESDDEDEDTACTAAAPHGGRGDVHLRLSELHAAGRFTDDVPHLPAAFYHLQMAALYDSVEGLLGLARMYSGLDRDTLLPQLVEVPQKKDLTIVLLQRAFERHASYEAACALAALLGDGNYIPFSGVGASVDDPQCTLAIEALLALTAQPCKLTQTNRERGEKDFQWGNFDAAGSVLMTRLAERYEAVGSYQDAADTYSEAAELATCEGKGKLAAKLYMKAEEVGALADDDDLEERNA